MKIEMTVSAPLLPSLDRRGGPGLVTRLVSAVCVIALLQVQWAGLLTGEGLVQRAEAAGFISNSIVVLVVPAKRKEATKAAALERLLTRQVRRLEQVGAYNLSPIPGHEQQAKANKLVEEALRALLLRTPKRAMERLAAAKKLLDAQPAAGGPRLWARLFKALGLVALSRNQLVPARDLLLRSLTLYPKQAEEEYVAYGANARELFLAVQKVRAAAPTGDLAVTKAVGPVEVWIDGVARGTAPLKLEDVPAGDHRVMLRRSGYGALRQFIKVLPGKTVTLDTPLKKASFHRDLTNGRKVLTANFNQPSVIEDRIRELRNELGTDQVLVIRAQFPKGSTQLKGYFLGADGAFKKVKAALPRDADYMEKAAEFLSVTSGAKLLADPDKRPLDQRKSVVVAAKKRASAAATYIDPNAPLFEDGQSEEAALTSKWYFWAGVGGGVVLIGVVAALIAGGDSEGAGYATGTVKINMNKASGN
ncbi:MAG: PEGA domain-containing protein [Myxococcales bacterium]|nr:PEGA domain-containing protein [Myxococcales bacterium]